MRLLGWPAGATGGDLVVVRGLGASGRDATWEAEAGPLQSFTASEKRLELVDFPLQKPDCRTSKIKK